MRRSRRISLTALVLVAISIAVGLSRATRATPRVRDTVVAALNERFDSRVNLESFQVSVFPRPQIDGAGLIIQKTANTNDPPLVRVGAFQASAGVFGLIANRLRLNTVELDRLEINVPPGGLGDDGNEPLRRMHPRLTIGEIIAHAAQLRLIPRNPAKLPRVFDIHDLHIVGYGEDDGAEFRARLTNPVPVGLVDTNGHFGPWRTHDPQKTPLNGTYAFTKVDMNTIKGIGGTLSSRGSYEGRLDRIRVQGAAEIPDFSIDIAGRPVPLSTRFTAIVDGTNGDTYLEAVDALLVRSHILARGAVVRTRDVKGRHTSLDITIDNARIEDLLLLAVKGRRPPITGDVRAAFKFVLPGGDVDVVRKLQLDGQFALAAARFTSFNVQQRINTLSRRGRGDAGADAAESVVSQLQGRFALRNATLSFSRLAFAVPGAVVQLAGSYQLEHETLDFAGDLLLEASLRETTPGMKQVFALIAQPLFRRHGGGSKIPIRVRGTRDNPEFGLDVKRALLPG